ncbi:hypothetical protein [Streptomyces sp. NPDC056661]|uniref:hypothetical protein n=1 Tax=Streptomyces sp. NPDC056661 TaxID=3345898 RepID=UPI0036BC02FD
MRKILPFKQPLAYGYQFYAFPLGILAVYPKASEWVLSNYIQLVYEYTDQSVSVPFSFYVYDYSVSPWLQTLRLNRQWCSSRNGRVNDIVREAIGKDFYVYLSLNERYVPQRIAYGGRKDWVHDALIYGIDDETNTFELYGYDERMKFRSTQISQDDLARAYYDTGDEPFYDVPFTMYRFDDAGAYSFDLGFVCQGIVEYLDSFNTSTHFQAQRDPWDRAYGLKTYDLLDAHLDGYGRGVIRYDPRNVQVLWEHKRMMVARMRRCAELIPAVGDIVKQYESVERQAWMLRALTIAHQTGYDRGDFRAQASSLLRRIRAAEEGLLGRFALELERGGPPRATQTAPSSCK